MAFNFLRFKQGGASDPKIRTDENASNEHTGISKIDTGAEGQNDVNVGSLKTRVLAAPSIAYGQVTVGTTATQIVPTRSNRRTLTIIMNGTLDCFIGDNAVTVGSGAFLIGVQGTGLPVDTIAAVYGRVASGSVVVSYIETFGD